MGIRRQGRERAVQFLFQCDVNPPDELDPALDAFWVSQRKAFLEREKGSATWGESPDEPDPDPEETALRMFADPLIRGVLEKRPEVDESIAKYAQNWSLNRMAGVDRNVLRLAVYELLFREDIPPVVTINEAVDIAKRFSTDESGKFVNGILDRLKQDLLRPARSAAEK
ncbi:MAG: transcription antitermination factor NusB [Verrucomicrobiales bacterium]|nr:transcription antitermination factor NusB [Verrucomicrobiales bacterium]